MMRHVFTAMMTLLCLSGCASVDDTAPANVEVEALPYQVKVLESDVPVWLLEDHTLPMVELVLRITQSGSAYDAPDASGTAYLAGQLLAEGTGTYPGDAFQKMLDQYGIQLSVSTGRDATVISMTYLSEHTDIAYELLGELLAQAELSDSALARIRAEHLADLQRLEERPSYRLNNAFYASAFTGHPYAMPVYGTLEGIQSLSQRRMQGYVRQHFVQSKMQVSVAGDTTLETLQQHLLPVLTALPVSAYQRELPVATLRTTQEPVTVPMQVPQTSVRIALPHSIRQGSDTFLTAYVLNHLVGGSSLSSRLGDNVRQKRGLTYSINSGLVTLDKAQWFSVNFATKNATAQEAIDVVMDTLQDIANGTISAEEVDKARRYITGSFPIHTDANAEKVAYLSMMQQFGLSPDYLQSRNEKIAHVSLQNVIFVAQELLNTQHTFTILAGDVAHD